MLGTARSSSGRGKSKLEARPLAERVRHTVLRLARFLMKTKKPLNPFFPLLLVVGVVFAITACAYGVMTVNLLSPAQVMGEAPERGLVAFLDHHGVTLLLSELGVLAVFTFAAIGTDDYWMRRAVAAPAEEAAEA